MATERAEGRRRYAICGLSNRGLDLFVLPLLGLAADDLSAHGDVVAILDVDEARVARFNSHLEQRRPFYRPDEFDLMISEVDPDVVLVATPDSSHAEYAVAALDRGVDVVTEKPMSATCEQVRAMLAAEQASAASLRVAHNSRYAPRHRQIKQMMLDGLIGRVTSVDLVRSVDEVHGSSYFRRWNRRRALSGGLCVHKSCHHLDLVNWLVDDEPEQVFAYGALNYYGPDSANNPARHGGADPYEVRLAQLGGRAASGESVDVPSQWRDLPYEVQYPPGRPLTIYDQEIDIEDTYAAVVRYRRGASLSYSITYSGPWEGYRMGINGTLGRIEAQSVTFRGRGETPESGQIVYYPMFGEAQRHDVRSAAGGHGGADPLLRRDLFVGESEESRRLSIAADGRQGAYAVAEGEAMWRSIADNRPYTIAELLDEPAAVSGSRPRTAAGE
jgi:predicted dehydrogenase